MEADALVGGAAGGSTVGGAFVTLARRVALQGLGTRPVQILKGLNGVLRPVRGSTRGAVCSERVGGVWVCGQAGGRRCYGRLVAPACPANSLPGIDQQNHHTCSTPTGAFYLRSLCFCSPGLTRSGPCPHGLPLLQGRMTLVLGPPGSGKSVFMQTLAGRLRPGKHLRVRLASGAGGPRWCLQAGGQRRLLALMVWHAAWALEQHRLATTTPALLC